MKIKKITRNGIWFGGGRADNVLFEDGHRVKVVGAGNGQFASRQRAPKGYTDDEIKTIAFDARSGKRRIMNTFNPEIEGVTAVKVKNKWG